MVVKRVAMVALPMNNSLERIPSKARIIFFKVAVVVVQSRSSRDRHLAKLPAE
ncbi:MAG: hypothetical protein PVI78_12060 [Anaerolineales bacterium]|jgi:hypothetical protein